MKQTQPTFMTSAAIESQFLKLDKPIIAIAGRSNVGKSSFINKLANIKSLARTSSVPGKTRTINYFDFSQYVIADLPGYGYAKVSKEEKARWGKMMDKFFMDRRYYDYVFVLVDIRHDPSQDDVAMINFLHSNAISFKIVATKADKLKRQALKEQTKAIARFFAMTENDIIVFSSIDGTGLSEVKTEFAKVSKYEVDI